MWRQARSSLCTAISASAGAPKPIEPYYTVTCCTRLQHVFQQRHLPNANQRAYRHAPTPVLPRALASPHVPGPMNTVPCAAFLAPATERKKPVVLNLRPTCHGDQCPSSACSDDVSAPSARRRTSALARSAASSGTPCQGRVQQHGRDWPPHSVPVSTALKGAAPVPTWQGRQGPHKGRVQCTVAHDHPTHAAAL